MAWAAHLDSNSTFISDFLVETEKLENAPYWALIPKKYINLEEEEEEETAL
jgi:hypothetical protein